MTINHLGDFFGNFVSFMLMTLLPPDTFIHIRTSSTVVLFIVILLRPKGQRERNYRHLYQRCKKIGVWKKYKQMRMWILGAQDRQVLSFCRDPFIYWTFMCIRIFSPWWSKELVLILAAKICAVNVMTRLVHNIIFSRWLFFSNYWMEKYVLRQVHIKIILFPIIAFFFSFYICKCAVACHGMICW